MARDGFEQAALMAQLQKKQEIKQRIRDVQTQESSALFEVFIRNSILFAIEARADIFDFFRSLSYNGQDNPMGVSMLWMEDVASMTERSVYELVLNDEDKQEIIVRHILQGLSSYQEWSDFNLEDNGGSFAMHGFDYAFGMSKRPSVSLVFDFEQTEYEGVYSLLLVDGMQEGHMLPGQVVLWQESDGMLARFMNQVIEGYLSERETTSELRPIRNDIMQIETMFEHGDELLDSVKDIPDRVIWKQMAQDLQKSQNMLKEYLLNYPKYENLKEAILLLGGGAQMIEQLDHHDAQFVEKAEEIAFMLDGAAKVMDEVIRQ